MTHHKTTKFLFYYDGPTQPNVHIAIEQSLTPAEVEQSVSFYKQHLRLDITRVRKVVTETTTTEEEVYTRKQ